MPDIFRFKHGTDEVEFREGVISLYNCIGVEISIVATKAELAAMEGLYVHGSVDGVLIEFPRLNECDDPVYEELYRWEPETLTCLKYMRANPKDCFVTFKGEHALRKENIAILHACIQQGIRLEVVPKNDLEELAQEVKRLAHDFIKEKV